MKYAIVTGACGGLGQAAVNRLTRAGWYVYAADINPEVNKLYFENSQVTGIVIDSTDENSVHEVFDQVAPNVKGLDAIVHLAGLLEVGSVAEVPAKIARRVMDVNLMGVYNVNRQFLPLILKQKGRIIIVTSETGVHTAAPFNGIYAMSKYALEAYADALRRELAFLGIRVIKIRPGAFKTGMTGKVTRLFTEAAKESVYFKPNLASGMRYLPEVYNKAHTPGILAGIILRALTAARPHITYSIRLDPLRTFMEYLPVRWADTLIRKVLS